MLASGLDKRIALPAAAPIAREEVELPSRMHQRQLGVGASTTGNRCGALG